MGLVPKTVNVSAVFLALPKTVNVSAAFLGPAENRKRETLMGGAPNFKTAHDTAAKITQNIVPTISSIYA